MTSFVLFGEIEGDCKKIIKKIAENFLSDKTYNNRDADFLIKYLQENILKKITELSDNFKYIITISLFGNDTSSHIEDTALYCDILTDGVISEKFVFKNISCIVNLICFAI
jgi:hypothetical protein